MTTIASGMGGAVPSGPAGLRHHAVLSPGTTAKPQSRAWEGERSGAECVLSLAGAGVESLVLAGEVEPPVLLEVPVRDYGPQGENRLRAVQAPPGAAQVEAVGYDSLNNPGRVARLACSSRSRTVQERSGSAAAEVENRQRGEGSRPVKVRMPGFRGDRGGGKGCNSLAIRIFRTSR